MSELPTVKVSECCDILDNLRIPLNAEEREKIKGNIPYCGANGIQGYISEYIFDEDLILLAEDGGNFDEYQTRPIAYRISGKSWVNNHAHVLRAKEGYDFSFVFYSLQHKNLVPFIKGGTRAKLNQAELREITIWDAPLPIQQRIGEIIETIDNQIDATQAFIDKYTAIKQGMMADLFSRGIDPETKALRPTFEEAPELYHKTPLGMLPKGWDVSDLGSISLRVTDGSHQAVSTVENGDIPFLFVSCVRGGKILWEKCSYISKEDYHLISKGREPRKGDILYTAVGSYGHAALVSEDSEFSFQRHIAYIKPNNQFVDSNFLSEFLNSEQTKSWADRVALGNAQKTVTLGELSKFPIVVPGKIEQEKIVGSLQAVNEVLESEYANLSKLQQAKQGLMKDLLTGKVPVPA
ncbi:restriction endonuclease subunit S [Vibrio gigantis]|uniref:restriction endonuclease subunit S n=1 Tax=Vibrio gigantis TaxID=296199 RepID=UPI0035A58364